MSVNPSFEFSKGGRGQFVAILAKYCQEFLNVLPTNTPREEAWVSTEMDTTDINRSGRVLNTSEYARHSLQDTFQFCVNVATRLSREQQRRGSNDITRFEGASLVSLAVNFIPRKTYSPTRSVQELNVEQFRLDFLSPSGGGF